MLLYDMLATAFADSGGTNDPIYGQQGNRRESKKTASPNEDGRCGYDILVGETGFELKIEPQRVANAIVTHHHTAGQKASYQLKNEHVAEKLDITITTKGNDPAPNQYHPNLPKSVQQNKHACTQIPPDLGVVVDAWHSLSEEVKAAILVFVRHGAQGG